ncbi:glycosyl hydrolase family 8 [Xylanibacter oryzae]|uniref:glycosyl hydrolase family 8 n=1 Tax=Xylanibacter oryzae TaxID=185293 RepID=UPI0004B52C21|nr:glycosyl hydrolase family 8 [Xylanibacter oryzae]
MKTIKLFLLSIMIACPALVAEARQPDTSQMHSPWTKGALETNSYRNLFVEMGYSKKQVDAKLKEVFNDVFYGPHKVYFEVGDSLGYITDIKNHDVRTEGMSYGMMIAVQFNRKDIFDRIWRWSKKYMQHQDGPREGYFAWSCKTDGTRNSEGSASDGELYYITSLIFASNRWGNDTGINYRKEALRILNCSFSKNGEDGVMPIFNKDNYLITFTPDKFGSRFTDPSYNIPAFYDVWSRWANDGRTDFWQKAAAAAREYLHKVVDEKTGLTPDMSNYDGTPLKFRNSVFNTFRYDSWRVPMNIALDYQWSCADREWQQKYGEKIQNFFYSKGIDKFVDQYRTDGTLPSKEEILPAGDYPKALRHSIGLVATTASVSLMCSNSISKEFVDRLWNAKHEPLPDGYFDAYYDGLIRLFQFMQLSGNYRIILPQADGKEPALNQYFSPIGKQEAQPDNDGFIRRWLLLEPINKPNRGNSGFTDTYLRDAFNKEYFHNQMTMVPKDGSTVKVGNQKLAWHAFDSNLFHVKLFRFASGLKKQVYGVLFWGVTIIDCNEEIPNVRLAAGSNSASMWWLNGKEVLLLSGDRRMVKDDGMSPRVTLHKGRNILRCAVINGPGMSDFCVRFIDEQGAPVKNYTINYK